MSFKLRKKKKIKKEKREPVLVQYIKQRVLKRNKNFVMVFIGPTGSGKSYSALRLAEQLDPTFSVDRVCFKAKDFMYKINELVELSDKGEDIRGKVLLWDEMGVEHNARSFMTISNRVINYFFQTSRHLNLIVIMTVPLLSFIDSSTRRLMHGFAEMQGIDIGNKTASVKVKLNQVNVMSGKEYPKYLRYRRNNRTYVSKKLKFKMPPKELYEPYELKRKAFTKELNIGITEKLLQLEQKEKVVKKGLTDTQIKVAEVLAQHGVEEAAKKLNVSATAIYAHKTNIEKKGYQFKPIWKDKHIIRYEIEDFNLKPIEKEERPQF